MGEQIALARTVRGGSAYWGKMAAGSPAAVGQRLNGLRHRGAGPELIPSQAGSGCARQRCRVPMAELGRRTGIGIAGPARRADRGAVRDELDGESAGELRHGRPGSFRRGVKAPGRDRHHRIVALPCGRSSAAIPASQAAAA